MTFSFVDIETTGSRMTHDRVIEIGILRVEEGNLVRTYNKLINPQTYLSPYIEQMTGISPLELEHAPTFDELKEEIMEMIDDSVFVAHNVRFDYGFLKNELKRYGLSLSLKQLCTVKLSRALYPQYRRHNLDAIIQRFNFPCENRHRALDDARVLFDFYSLLPKQFEPTAVDQTINRLMKSPSIPTHLKTEDVKALPENPGVYIFYGEDDHVLYVGKSTNIKERVLSHFTNDYTSTKEMNLALQVKHIETVSTAGELGALLKEAELIKKLQPVYNRQLRKLKTQTFIKKMTNVTGYFTVELQDVELITGQETPDILGIFKSQRQAKEYLIKKATTKNLCEKLLGLEKGSGPCFAAKIERCRGACVSQEKPLSYNTRFIEALSDRKIKAWPFNGPIKIVEFDEETELTDEIMVDSWCMLSQEDDDRVFDYDTYKILATYIFDPKNRKNISALNR